nr:uncharacterized protein LOC121114213 [Lepeophtheirus salmonis]XP_040564029.1 uncharacterized protein LOC121114213 [Lepeophtheirus salmonis]XP_040564031.1 uncharacterized protein LOC121114213 [Lepeophtheirus salmonis]
MSDFIILDNWSNAERQDLPDETEPPTNLSTSVSKYLEAIVIHDGSHKRVTFDRIVIIKDRNGNSETLLRDLISKADDGQTKKKINFGVFTEDGDKVKESFKKLAKRRLKELGARNRNGRIFCLELNGTGKGVGVIAESKKIYSWMDK